MRRLVATAAVLLLAAAPATAQQDALRQSLDRLAGAWQRGDVAAIAALASRSGVTLDIDGAKVAQLPARQVAAGLRRVFEDRENVSTRVSMARQVAGEPNRAFGEISWQSRVRGTSIPERGTVFVALVRENGDWRIAEIRLLR